MSRLEWLRKQRDLYEFRSKKALYSLEFGYAIRLYEDLIQKEENS